MANDNGTTTPDGQAPDENEAPDAGAPEGSGTGNQPDEVTLLKSRAKGLDAKVTSLSAAAKAAEERAAAAEAKLAQYEAGKVGADEALRAQLIAEQEKTAAAEKRAALALVQAQYPEAFKELGDAAAALTTDQLASLEARLEGVAAGNEETPTPRHNNPSRTSGAGNGAAKPATIAETEELLKAQLRTVPW